MCGTLGATKKKHKNMQISSDSIFHLTKSKEILINILTEGFKFSYCRDIFKNGNSIINFYTPIVSFCDIPLSQIEDHVSKYGKYGIGLSKKWAQRMRLNPVLYMDKESFLFESYLTVYKEYITKKAGFNWKELSEPEKGIIEILRYTKMVQDDLYRESTGMIYDYKFSDEKEWRIAAGFSEEYSMLLDGFIVDAGERKHEMNQHLENLRLEFEDDDIKYLIFENEEERVEIIKDIRLIKKFNNEQQDLMISKLICYEDISRDI